MGFDAAAYSSSLSSVSSSSPLVSFAGPAVLSALIVSILLFQTHPENISLLTRVRILLRTWVLKCGEVALDLFNSSFLLGFAHGLIFLPWLRGGWGGWGGSTRWGILRPGGVFAYKYQKFVEHLVRKLVNVQFQFIFLNALFMQMISTQIDYGLDGIQILYNMSKFRQSWLYL